ncbi:hypothetical protein Avbf_18973, partial [Armadillidium vulgare]
STNHLQKGEIKKGQVLNNQPVSLLTLTTQSDQNRFCPYLRELFENWLRIS